MKGREGKEDKEAKSLTNTIAESTVGNEVLRQRIAEKAYELYQKRGESHGHDVDDWLEAERSLLSDISSQAHSKAKKPRSRVQRSKKG
jgi:hypothetical protein